MTNRTALALLGSGIATTLAILAAATRWPGRDAIITIAAAAWTLCAIEDGNDRVTRCIAQAAIRAEQAGDDRHADGIIEGMRRATPGLREVR